jgi:hypothetical protein
MVAALPLIGLRQGCLRLGHLPGNAWSTAGELLLDPEIDGDPACERLIEGMQSLGWPLVFFGGVRIESPTWQQFAAALARCGLTSVARERFRVEQVEIGHDWPIYLAALSANQRRQMRRARAKAEQAGTTRLKVFDQLQGEQIARWLQRGFEIENLGWKGAAGSSVLKSSGIFEFYLRQAELLAAQGQLRLVFLEHRGQPIAFEYGWAGKGVYFSPKVGYDEAFAHFCPGRLLRAALLEQFHADPDCRLVDYLGPSARATAEWATRSDPLARVAIAIRPLGRLALGGYRLLQPLVNRLRAAAGRVPSSGEPAAAAVPSIAVVTRADSVEV